MSKVFNRDVNLAGGARLVKGSTVLIDADGNIDAPVTTTNLTTSGNTTLGDTSADTLSVPSTSAFTAPITVGVNDTGHDVTMYGATSGTYLLWDESADSLKLVGAASLDVSGRIGFSGTETIAAGGTSTAIDLTVYEHYIDADAGGDTFTIAAGANGQKILLHMASATGTATITPAAFSGGTSITFNAAGDSVELYYSGAASAWVICGGNSYTVV